MKHTHRNAALLAAVAVLLAGPVAAQDPAPPAPDFAGTYSLAQVDDAELPVQIHEAEGCTEEITSATLTLAPDNTWVIEANVRRTCGETVEETSTREEGNYAVSAEGVDFDPDTAEPDVQIETEEKPSIVELATGTMEEGALRVTLEEDTKVLVFRK